MITNKVKGQLESKTKAPASQRQSSVVVQAHAPKMKPITAREACIAKPRLQLGLPLGEEALVVEAEASGMFRDIDVNSRTCEKSCYGQGQHP